MVDTFGHLRGRLLLLLLGLWTLCATRSVVHKSTGRPRARRRLVAAKTAGLVDAAELEASVANQPFAVVGVLDRDRFADERLADEDEAAGPLDFAVRAHPAHSGALA